MAEITRMLSGLLPESRYVIRVRALNNLGVYSNWSDSISFETEGDTTVPSPPTSLTANFSSASLILTWVAPTTNTDGSALIDLKGYEITLTVGVTSKIYNVTDNYFNYSLQQNIEDWGTVQSDINISVKSVDHHDNKSSAATLAGSNDAPTDPTDAPIVLGGFESITITMIPPDDLLDHGGFFLERSADGSTGWTLIADQTGDTFYDELLPGDTDTYYYRFKVRDRFGQLSDGYSPVGSGSALEMNSEIPIDNVLSGTIAAETFVMGTDGFIQSAGYTASGTPQGYRLSSEKLIFQNGSIEIVGQAGALHLDDDSFRAVYGGNTRFFIDDTGVYFGGSNSANANIIIDTDGVTTFQSSAGAYDFVIDSGATGSEKYLRLWDGVSTDSFYLTADGEAYFKKGVINIGGSSAFNVDASGNVWLGNGTFASAPFSVSSTGALVATSATIEGDITATSGSITGSLVTGSLSAATISGTNINGGTITGVTFRTGTTSEARVQMNGSSNKDRIEFYDASTLRGYISGTSGTLAINGTSFISLNTNTAVGGYLNIQATGLKIGDTTIIDMTHAGSFSSLGVTGGVLAATVGATGTLSGQSLVINGTTAIDSSRNGSFTDVTVTSEYKFSGTTADITYDSGNDVILISNAGIQTEDESFLFANTSITQAAYINSVGLLTRASSALRTKKDIALATEEFDTSGIFNIIPKCFTYIDTPDPRRHLGAIAEEVYEISPLLAIYHEEEGEVICDDIEWRGLAIATIDQLKKLRDEFDAYVATHS